MAATSNDTKRAHVVSYLPLLKSVHPVPKVLFISLIPPPLLCRVNENKCVVIGDFGLARAAYSANHSENGRGGRLPVKWMPPEALRDGIGNEKTDVVGCLVQCCCT